MAFLGRGLLRTSLRASNAVRPKAISWISRASVSSNAPSPMTPILTENAMQPIGPYSQAILTPPSTSLIFISGQLPALASGELVSSNIEAETAACINALSAILEASGSSLQKIVKTTVFLTDLESDFGRMNEVYAKMITHKPARSCVEVRKLPRGVRVEIEAVAAA